MAGIARLIRQICLLREQGDGARADRLQAEDLEEAVRDFRATEGVDLLTDADLEALFSEEARRVADAAVLAELLVPRLREALASSSALSAEAAPVRAVASTPTVVRAPAPPAEALSIPDLLDAMLALERNDRRPRPAVKT